MKEFGEDRFTAGGGVFLKQTFLDGLVELRVSFTKVNYSGALAESLDGRFDIFLKLFIMKSSFDGLTGGFLGGFNDWHSVFLLN